MLFFIIFLCIILVAVLMIPLYVDISYEKNQSADSLNMSIGFLFFKIKIKPKSEKKSKKEADKAEDRDGGSFMESFRRFFKIYDTVKDDVKDLLFFASEHGIKLRLLSAEAVFGLGNAFSTGIMKGVFDALSYNILAFLHNRLTINEWNVDIQPDFDKKRYDIALRCILKVKNVHIIVMAVKALRIYFKTAKVKVGIN